MPKKEVEIYTRGARKLKVLLPESKLTKSQKIRKIRSLSDGSRFVLTIRYDDECGNGKNSFSMITSRERQKRDGEWVMTSGGCADHSEIEKYFPNLKHLVKWHLFDTSGPMHYLANTLYHAEEVEGGQVIGYEERLKFRGFPMTFKINKAFFQFLKERQEHGSKWDHEIYPELIENVRAMTTNSALSGRSYLTRPMIGIKLRLIQKRKRLSFKNA